MTRPQGGEPSTTWKQGARVEPRRKETQENDGNGEWVGPSHACNEQEVLSYLSSVLGRRLRAAVARRQGRSESGGLEVQVSSVVSERERGGVCWEREPHSHAPDPLLDSSPAGAWAQRRCRVQLSGPLPNRYVADCRMRGQGGRARLELNKCFDGFVVCVSSFDAPEISSV
jgi:hypothetical protein